MPKIQFYPLDVTYKIRDNKAYILLFGRAVDGKTITVVDSSFMPYFWVILKRGEDISKFRKSIEGLTEKDKDVVLKIEATESHKKDYLGDDIEAIKVIVNQPQAVVHFRELVGKKKETRLVLEADVKFVKRYLIDKAIISTTLYEVEGEAVAEKVKTDYIINAKKITQVSDDSMTPKMLAFDIETYNPAGKNVVADKYPILMVSLFGKDFKKVITWKRFETKHKYIEFVDGEAELIKAFRDAVEEYRPDILVGYFSDGFDFPYIRERADKYKINLDLGWDHSSVSVSKGKSPAVDITGMVHIDIFRFIRFVLGGSLETDYFDMNSVAQELLGEKKMDIELDNLHEIWDKHPDKLEPFCEYNLHDSLLAYSLCEKVIPNIIELVKIVSLPMFDVARMSFSQLVESYLMRQAPSHNVLVPNKPEHDEIKERLTRTYKGAFVFEPKAGLYKDIVVFDFRSLYPTIIASHNISPENLNRKDCSDDERDYVPFDEEDKKKKVWFCRGKKKFIPKMIEELITRRMRIKEIMKKKKDKMLEARSYSLKILANASYGYLGFYASRWYSVECADAITGYGRHYIKQVIEKAQKNSFNVIYSDTDSVFLALDGKSKKDALGFIEKVNNELPELMELEFEGFYPRGIFVSAKLTGFGAKKKYALMNEEGGIVIKGFETVRRNWSLIAKEAQEEVLKIILKENDIEKAVGYVQDVVKQLRQNRIELVKVIIYTQLQKEISSYEAEGPHVAAAKRMEKKGLPVGPGSVIQYVIVSGKEKIRDRARLLEEVKQKDYDSSYYIDNQVIPAVESIFKVLDRDIKSIVAVKDQSRLGEFF